MTFQHHDETDRFTEPDESQGASVRVVRPDKFPPLADPFIDLAESFVNPGFEDISGPYEPEETDNATKIISRRQEIINEGAQLAFSAVDTFRAALDTISIVDLATLDKYEKVLRDLSSAAEDFERKL
jgi:hypothetical protein